MKNIKKILILTILFLTSTITLAYGNEKEVFYYNSFDVDIKIKEKGILEVTETRDTVFNESRRGIFFNLSENFILKYNDKEIVRKFNIYDIKILSKHKKKITRNYYGVVNIRLGDPDSYANAREKYIISYKILTKDLDLDSDIFYYNLLGREAVNTKKFTFKITSYKDTDFHNAKFYKGINSRELFTNIKTDINSNSITGEVLEELKANEPLTTMITFDKGFYNYPKAKNPIVGMIFIILSGALLFIVFIFHSTKGKDDEIIEKITMKIPDGYNSADIAYLYENQVSKKAIMSLLFQLANEGYIKIDADKKRFLITRLKKYDGEDKAKDKVMKMIFYKNQDEIDLKQSNSRLGRELYDGFFRVSEITKNKFKKEKKLFKYNYFIVFISIFMLSILQVSYLMYGSFTVTNEIFFNYNIAVYLLIFIINFILIFTLEKTYLNLKSKFYIFIGLIITSIISVLAYLQVLYMVEQNVLSISGLDIAFAVICLLITITIEFLGKRTEYANKILGEVKGLHTFIKYTKEDKLKLYLDENPNLFYDILPVAFAFGLTKKWLDLFKNMDIEAMNDNMYLYNYSTINYLSNYDTNIESIMPSYNEYRSEIISSSSSSSGFSGSGGGGFGGSTSSGSW